MITESRITLRLATRIPCTSNCAVMEMELDISRVFDERDGGDYLALCAESLRNQMVDKIREWECRNEPESIKEFPE